jgi:hypothetical protein
MCCFSYFGKSLVGDVIGRDEVRIHYTGIGSIPSELYVSEGCFRSIMKMQKDSFNEQCPYDPTTCHLADLVLWAGAEYAPRARHSP